MPVSSVTLQQETQITLSELAEHISQATGLAADYEMLRHRITRALRADRLPALVTDIYEPRQGRPTRRVLLRDLDTWVGWFKSHV